MINVELFPVDKVFMDQEIIAVERFPVDILPHPMLLRLF